jgi:phytoene/squalene synthetase
MSGSAASARPGAAEGADRRLAADPALAAVLEGFAQPDQAARAARTLRDALRREAGAQPFADYAGLAQHLRGTANPWGRLWLLAAGVENPRAEALADGLCTGLALTGLLVDAPADARAGRLRLPLDELARFGVSPEELARGAPGPGWAPLTLLQIERARRMLQAGAPLARELRGRRRLAVRYAVVRAEALLRKLHRARGEALRRPVRVGPADWPYLAWRVAFGR